MATSFLALVALVVLLVALASRYVKGRQRPSGPAPRPGRSDDAIRVSVYGQGFEARRIEGYGLYLPGRDARIVKGDTLRVEGRAYTVKSVGQIRGAGGDRGLIVEIVDLP